MLMAILPTILLIPAMFIIAVMGIDPILLFYPIVIGNVAFLVQLLLRYFFFRSKLKTKVFLASAAAEMFWLIVLLKLILLIYLP
ncbi:MAG: hypothetical protein V4478_00270 [Patescibacteria group bacterium]